MQSSGPVDVSIVVVSYNTRDLTLAALDSVAAQTRATSYEMLIVDNASTDGSADALRAHVLGAKTLASRENLGFSRANNLAARGAVGEFILLLNPDTVILDGAIDRLVAFARAAPHAGIWGGRTLFANGHLNPSSCWGRQTPWNLACRALGLTAICRQSNLFNGEAYGGWRRDSIREVDIVSGCFLLIRRTLWEDLGGFDPAFFMYGEEADLCLRAAHLGARPMVTPDATIVHYGGASERTRAGKMSRLLRAKTTLIRRHWPAHLRQLGLGLTAAWPLTRWLSLACVARFTGNPSHGEAAATWREIWQSRSDWLDGYDTTAADLTGSTISSTSR